MSTRSLNLNPSTSKIIKYSTRKLSSRSTTRSNAEPQPGVKTLLTTLNQLWGHHFYLPSRSASTAHRSTFLPCCTLLRSCTRPLPLQFTPSLASSLPSHHLFTSCLRKPTSPFSVVPAVLPPLCLCQAPCHAKVPGARWLSKWWKRALFTYST